MIYNTWPLIDGRLVPEAARLFFQEPLWRNFFENALTVQFDHRMVAYVLLLAAVLHVVDVARNAGERSALAGAVALACALAIQMCLGIRPCSTACRSIWRWRTRAWRSWH